MARKHEDVPFVAALLELHKAKQYDALGRVLEQWWIEVASKENRSAVENENISGE
jgi:hypothetical protein